MSNPKQKPLGKVLVVGDNGVTIHGEWVWPERSQTWAALLDNFPHTVEGEDIIVRMPRANAVFKKVTPMACLYNALDSYMTSLLGRKLDSSDRNFFDDHLLTASAGVSQPNTLRVAQEIIEPYGLRVSRVRMLPGTMLSGDLLQWPNVLGMNPLAMMDTQTTNEAFCQATGLDPDIAARKFRFDYSDAPLRPCISCGEYQESDKGTKYIVGHASYEAPRSPNGVYILQFQIDHKEKVDWDHDPVFAEVQGEGEMDLNLLDCKGQDGQSLWRSLSVIKGSKKDDTPGQKTVMVHQPLGLVGQQLTSRKGQIRECFMCGSMTGDRVGANLCIRCWSIWCGLTKCSTCENPLTGPTMTSRLSGLSKRNNDWWIIVTCCWCNERTEMLALPGSDTNAIGKAIRGEKDEPAWYKGVEDGGRLSGSEVAETT